MQNIFWNQKTLEKVRDFPEPIRKEIGYLLYQLQIGDLLSMPHSRPMPSIAPGCNELRVKGKDGSYRIFYLLKLKNRILVFHAFQKKTQKTPKQEIEIGKRNLKDMLNEKE